MKKISGLLMVFGCFSITSCKNVDNEFIIRDPSNVISSAEIRLCGKRLNLTKFSNGFSGRVPIECEGKGSIVIRLINGTETSCPIGYITPGAEQTFEYVVENGRCQ